MKPFQLHLVSDSTGETVAKVSRACLAQFTEVVPVEHTWSMIRRKHQIREALAGIKANPGIVLFTLVDQDLRDILVNGCREFKMPCISVLDPIVDALGTYLGREIEGEPGRQHVLNAEYFNRIDAMQFMLTHDDGQSTWNLHKADIVVVGVSRTSKTPTCIYLANRGFRTANIPIVPGCPLPDEVMTAKRPLVVGLTTDPKRLVEIRRNRLRMLKQDEKTDYIDLEVVTEEVLTAKRLFSRQGWPMVDVTRKSVEEIAASILQLHKRKIREAARTETTETTETGAGS